MSITTLIPSAVIPALFFWSGHDLHSRLTSNDRLHQYTATGYIMGISDAISGETACPPKDISAGTLSYEVLVYLQKNPEDRNLGAAFATAKALIAKFPCAER